MFSAPGTIPMEYPLSMADGNISHPSIENRGAETPNEGCNALQSNHTGKMVLVDTGNCRYLTKVCVMLLMMPCSM